MPVDPQIQLIIDGMAASDVAEFSALGHLTVRELCESMLLPFEAGPFRSIEERRIPVDKGEITVRIYYPEAVTAGKAPPLIVYFHGGGWSIGSINTHDPICRGLAVWTPAVVVSVQYRLAPEHPFPVPLEDCYAATYWAQQHAKTLGADPARLVVAGDSAGGNLAAEMCILARDRKRKGEKAPTIAYQLLLYPITDCDFETASYQENAQGYVLRRSDMRWFWDQYIKNPAERNNPYAAPLRADLHDLPQACVVTAEFDTLRDEGNAYAKKLIAAGVKVHHEQVPGVIHGFIGFAAICDVGQKILQECSARISAALKVLTPS